ncbi:MAG: phosphate ABC transporter ATP-binding protein [Bryobacteraceae bacterium]
MTPAIAIETRRLDLWYGAFHALKQVNICIAPGRITSLIGPSGCGKSTLLRCFNRMNERFGHVRTGGSVLVQGHDIHHPEVSLVELRKAVGMVFQRPNPLPISIAENVLFGLRLHSPRGAYPRAELDALVEGALRQVGLWDSVRDGLQGLATALSLEQRQKLCIARLLPLKPSIILMDEPCSALDAQGTRAIEDLMKSLVPEFTQVVVTHNMAQAKRVSEDCNFMLLGEVVEQGPTARLFEQPKESQTRMYIAGKFG